MADLRGTLTRIYEQHGALTPEVVVEEARPETSELHHHFEWDDSIAAEKHRRAQARQLIRSVRISFSDDSTGERKSIRAFHSLRQSGDAERRGYAPTEDIVQDEFATKVLLRECKRAIADLRKKYGHLEEFVAMVRAEVEGLAS